MSKKIIRVALSGANGRMGQELIKTITNKKNQVVLSIIFTHNSNKINSINSDKIYFINLDEVSNIDLVKDNFDILIDFTCPEATMKYLNFCYKYNKKIIIGTTGFNNKQKKLILEAANKIGIVFSANFSIGINLILNILQQVTKIIGLESDIEIIEYHHRNKIDSPSGTALEIGTSIAKNLGYNLSECAIYSRYGTNGKRKNKNIGFSSIRAGNIIGEHKIMFINDNEELKITHKVSNRIAFANGVIKAAQWLFRNNQGLFSMNDVLLK